VLRLEYTSRSDSRCHARRAGVCSSRVAVRTALVNVLKPKLRRKGATDTHAALLQLARSRDGGMRLVTTNFDRIFQRLILHRHRLLLSPAEAILQEFALR